MDLLRHLRSHNCELVREGGRHSWCASGNRNKRSAVPRHNEITETMAKKVCKDFGIPPLSNWDTYARNRRTAIIAGREFHSRLIVGTGKYRSFP